MPVKCNVVGSDGSKCANGPLNKKSVVLTLKLCCNSCIPNVGNDLESHGSDLVRLTNSYHDDDITDLSLRQIELRSIIRRLRDNGITVEDDYVESYLLDFLKTESWEANRISFQKGKKSVDYIFYV
eukprot:CAMPEP_0201701866 /NCGR_PEP_ID=MMETSP0578-20130828/34361_1 /ASSEMBLY_ACC=CAM_ASM_000663 /TAXON_ID=267565 /ORGANISM="Skeletonema grethea, Strain CCMP 1804" /LENGTH=125 /DNA_ID=CAMNT_0048189281 /DNA_START=285 /DNA_END=658 /DNA_ORIENTATION=-